MQDGVGHLEALELSAREPALHLIGWHAHILLGTALLVKHPYHHAFLTSQLTAFFQPTPRSELVNTLVLPPLAAVAKYGGGGGGCTSAA